METLSTEIVLRLRVAQAVTIALLLLTAILSHRLELRAENSPLLHRASSAQLR